MKALSIHPEYAMSIMLGEKTIECRTWRTEYRGKLLVCSSNRPTVGTISGHALCVVNLVDVVPFRDEYVDAAMCDAMPDRPMYAWMLDDIELIEPFPIKGKLGLYDVDDSLIRVIPESVSDHDALKTYYEPLIKWSDRYTLEAEVKAWWNDLLSQAL